MEQYTKMKKMVSDIRNYSERKKLYEAMINLKESISLLSLSSASYNESLVNNNSIITNKTLENEKKQCLKRRYWAKMDLD